MKSGQSYPNNRQRRPRRVSNNNNNNNNRRQNSNNNPNKHWESLGPNVRIRGSASQIYDKYIGLAEDAKRNGDRVMVENLKQHAEHYLRLLNIQQAQRQERQNRQQAEQNAAGNSAENTDKETDETSASSSEETADDGVIVEDLTPKSAPISADTDDADNAAMN